MMETVSFTLNGRPVEVTTDSARPLLWVLRTDLGLTGTKFGCGQGLCGACTVLIGKQAVRSCLIPLSTVKGKDVTTIEGLVRDGKPNAIQEAFIEHDAQQCGFCTPGMIVNAYSILLNNPRADRKEIIEKMDGNLCRCGAHTRILQAIETAAKEMGGDR